MRRFFVKNLLFTIITNVLVMPVWVICIDRVVQNRVGTKEYGNYFVVNSLAVIFSIVLDFGIANYNTRSIAQKPDSLKDLFPGMMSAKLLLILIYAVITCCIGIFSGYNFWEMLLLVGVILIQAFQALVQFIRSNVSALHKFKLDSILSVIARLLMIFTCGALLIYQPTAHHFKIEWFIETQVICYFLTAIISYIALKRIHPFHFHFSFQWPVLFKVIKDSLPYALLIFLMSVYTRSDSWLIKQLCINGATQSGIYAAAYRWIDISNTFGLIFATILLPLFGRMLAEKQDVNQIIELCVNLLLPVSLIVSMAAIFYGSPIMHLLYTAATDYYGIVFGWVMASFPAFCMIYVYSTLLTANGSLKQLNWLALGGTIINLSLNFYLIAHLQALGAAITGFITQTLMALGFIIVCVKRLNVSIPFKWALSHLMYMLLTAGIGYASTFLPFMWMVRAGIFALASLALMFAFRFVSAGAIKQLMMSKQ